MSYEVKLDVFEGPLDLLLHLIKRLEIDIYDIPMAQLTQQYLQHIEAMRTLQLDELSEYLVLAATLIEIKSKTLLPIHDVEGDDVQWEEEEDPREALVEQLLKYQRYKELAIQLQSEAQQRANYFTKLPAPVEEIDVREEVPQLNVFDLISAFQKMLDRKQLREPLVATIEPTTFTVEDKMKAVETALKKAGGTQSFEMLFEVGTIGEIVVTFLAILEMARHQMIAIEQQSNFSTLEIHWRGGHDVSKDENRIN